MNAPRLHSIEIAAERPARWIYLLHGIFGAGRNWATIARRLIERRPDWGAILVDLRLHGHSQGFPPPHTLAACVRDLAALVRGSDRPADALLGHSFGGKVALLAAPALRPTRVWVVDSTPSRRAPGGSAYRMMMMLRRLPAEYADRNAALARLEQEGLAPRVARWMATNLVLGRDGVYRWRFDLDGLEDLLDDFFRTDVWGVVERAPEGMSLEFVKATESDVLSEAECVRLEAPPARDYVTLHRLQGGHWIHVDDPDGLVELLATP
ncbi:MAG: alpha/beta fold hydrolase [Gemmatimonadota bacterium]